MNSAPSNMQRPQTAKALSASQTLLWFSAGVAGMFLIVSALFAIKLGLQGSLPFTTASQAASAPEQAASRPTAVTPPVQSTATGPGTSNSDFESGSDGILPPEAAHLAKVNIATASPTPAPATPAAPAPSAPQAEPAIGKRVGDWAAAWQNKAIDAYLGHYAPDFKPAGKLTHGDWLAQRRQRLSRPGAISVEIIDLQIEQSGDTASARFQQTYRIDAQTLTDEKTLELVLRVGRWLILREYTHS